MSYQNLRKIKTKKHKSRLRRIIERLFLIGFFFGLGAIAGLAVVFYYFSLGIPAIGPLLEGYDPPQTTRILAADGSILGELFIERRTVVPIKDMPPIMVNAVIAAEDADFRTHEGLDYPGMFRAMFTNVTSGRLAQGASTITQQVARTFFLSREKTFARKIREILLTKRIEEQLTKDEILYLYLNQINFGHARYGVGEAASYYFEKEIKDITVAEAALLAGIPKGPSIYEPIGHAEQALQRRTYVLGEMVKHGFVSESEAELAKSAPLSIRRKTPNKRTHSPEAISKVLAELEDVVELDRLKHGGYVIETSLDPRLQKAAMEALQKGLSEVDSRHKRTAPYTTRKTWPSGNRGKHGKLVPGRVYLGEVVGRSDSDGYIELNISGHRGRLQVAKAKRYNPKSLPPSKFARKGAKLRVTLKTKPVGKEPVELTLAMGPEAAIAAVDPSTGMIRALVGGYNVKPGGFDRASQARRQPGSAFKPFVYLEALRSRKFTAATMLDDSPEVEGEWKPKNSHGDSFEGSISAREALARSLNLPAVKLIRNVGPSNVAILARKLGIKSKLDEGPALALGASSVTPLELAGSYATIAAGGIRRGPWMVKRVINPQGHEVPLIGRTDNRAVAPEEAYAITSLLQSVVEMGTGKKARALGRPAAGKTGTTNDAKDAWFVGFTPDIAAAVWVGFDEPRSIGNKEYGGRAALPIWVDFMKEAHRGLPARDFDQPDGIITVEIDPASGLLAYEGQENTREEIFIEGTEPVESALPPELVSLEDFMFEQEGNVLDETDGGMDPKKNLFDAGIRE